MRWQERAACKGKLAIMLVGDRPSPYRVTAAKALCAVCPVLEQCAESALREVPTSDFGSGDRYAEAVAGGMTQAERMQARRAMAREAQKSA